MSGKNLAETSAALPPPPASRSALSPSRRAVSFIVIGGVGLVVDLAVLTLGEKIGLTLAAARALSVTVATCVTYILNRKYTFGASGLPIHREATRYAGVTLAMQSINYGLALLLVWADPALPHPLAAAVGAATAAIFSYHGQRAVTFRGLGAGSPP